MARTLSNMMPLGTTAQDFQLIDTRTNELVSAHDMQGRKGTLVMFICNHCPFVIHLIESLTMIANESMEHGIGVLAISSNDVENYPEDSPENMTKFAQQYGFKFPYLYDESQVVAKTYQAACTPDFFLFDENLSCVYRGQFDSSRPGNDEPVTGNDLKNAMDHLIEGTAISSNQLPSIGCNIKWRS